MHHQTDLRGAPEHGSEHHEECWRPGPPRRSSHRWGGPRPRRLTASAAVVTPGLPTIDITLPSGTTQSTLDKGSKDTVYTGTTISIDDPVNDANDYTTPAAAIGSDIGTAEVKGRGNYTWTLAKKPYQIKLDGSKPVLGMGSAKTWILLANYADMSLMRNKLAYDWRSS